MNPHELDSLELTASRTSIREALLLAYHMGVADAFIERTSAPTSQEHYSGHLIDSLMDGVDQVTGGPEVDA